MLTLQLKSTRPNMNNENDGILKKIQEQNLLSFQALIEQVSKLTDGVQKLVVIDARRVEREKNQDIINNKQSECNKRLGDRLDKNQPIVDWANDLKGTVNKIKIPVFAALVFGLLKLVGFDWGK